MCITHTITWTIAVKSACRTDNRTNSQSIGMRVCIVILNNLSDKFWSILHANLWQAVRAIRLWQSRLITEQTLGRHWVNNDGPLMAIGNAHLKRVDSLLSLNLIEIKL